ncbi:MAG: ATP-binding protein [Phascolarctobacterium sp.]|nr:ATP-binding protein [Candidatus Phascolarctobacterium caballi]
MKITLENIGKVKNAEIEIKGLTVITGGNNSGKTTVGKALFSLLNVISDYEKKAEVDQKIGMDIFLRDISRDVNEIQHLLYRMSFKEKSGLFDEHIKDIQIFIRKSFAEKNYVEFKNVLLAIKEEIDEILFNLGRNSANDNLPIGKQLLVERSKIVIEKVTDILDRLENFDINDFVLNRIQKSLNDEFSKQIIPVRYNERKGNIKLQFAEYEPILFSVKDNQIEFVQITDRLFSPYRRVFLIDDPYLVDNLSDNMVPHNLYGSESKSIICKHDEHLVRYLRSHREDNYFATWLNTKEKKDIYNFISEVMPGDRVDKSDGMYYVEKGAELKVSNLATGSKMFFLVKDLFEEGLLDRETVLILDEPEAHLHPEWQNIFAEFIVRLVKFIGVKVLLTTHSPNFMLALETMSLQYKLGDVMQTYKTEMCDDGYQVTYRKVSDDLDIVYTDFIRAMVRMQTMKKRLLEGIDEDGK